MLLISWSGLELEEIQNVVRGGNEARAVEFKVVELEPRPRFCSLLDELVWIYDLDHLHDFDNEDVA
jgi:hypothetical protein